MYLAPMGSGGAQGCTQCQPLPGSSVAPGLASQSSPTRFRTPTYWNSILGLTHHRHGQLNGEAPRRSRHRTSPPVPGAPLSALPFPCPRLRSTSTTTGCGERSSRCRWAGFVGSSAVCIACVAARPPAATCCVRPPAPTQPPASPAGRPQVHKQEVEKDWVPRGFSCDTFQDPPGAWASVPVPRDRRWQTYAAPGKLVQVHCLMNACTAPALLHAKFPTPPDYATSRQGVDGLPPC